MLINVLKIACLEENWVKRLSLFLNNLPKGYIVNTQLLKVLLFSHFQIAHIAKTEIFAQLISTEKRRQTFREKLSGDSPFLGFAGVLK